MNYFSTALPSEFVVTGILRVRTAHHRRDDDPSVEIDTTHFSIHLGTDSFTLSGIVTVAVHGWRSTEVMLTSLCYFWHSIALLFVLEIISSQELPFKMTDSRLRNVNK